MDDLYVDGLINMLLPLIKLGLYSKSSAMSRLFATAARDLAVLSPHIMVPPLLAVAEEGLTYIVSPHRTSTALKLLAALTPIFLDADIFPDGAQSLPQALQLTLPGIDPNDPSKTHATMRFIAGATARFRDLLDTDAIPGLYAFLEDYVPSLLDRIFLLFSALEAPAKKTRFGHHSNPQVPHILLSTVMENLFSALPAPIVLHAAKRIAREIAGSATTNAMKHYGVLVRVSASAAALAGEDKNPSPDIFLSVILGQVLEESDGKFALSSLSKEELVWRIRMLAQACRCVGPGMEAYLDRLSAVISLAMEKQDRLIYKAGGRLLRGILEGLTSIQSSYEVGDAKPGLNEHGEQEQDVKWRIPSSSDWQTAFGVVNKFIALAESMVYGYQQDPSLRKVIMNRDVLFRALRLLHALQRGARWLVAGVVPDHFEGLQRFESTTETDNDLPMTKSEALLALKRPVSAGFGGGIDAESRTRAIDVWERIYGLVSKILAAVLVERPDDGALLYRCLEPIELAAERLSNTSPARLAHDVVHLFKSAYKPVMSVKRPHGSVGGIGRAMAPFVFRSRMIAHHEARLSFAAAPSCNNRTLFEAIMGQLWHCSLNDFPRVRTEARGALTRGLRISHPKYRYDSIVKVIDILSATAKTTAMAQRSLINDDTPMPSGGAAMDIDDTTVESSSPSKTKKPDLPHEKMMGASSIIRSSAVAPIVMRTMPLFDKMMRAMVETLLVAERPDVAVALSQMYAKVLSCIRPLEFDSMRFFAPDLLTVPPVGESGAERILVLNAGRRTIT